MARGKRGSRAVGSAVYPTPTGSSNAMRTMNALEPEGASDDVGSIPIGDLSLSPSKGKVAIKPFPLMSLPSELRLRIYEYHFADTASSVVDLDPDNHKKLWRMLALFKTCRMVYAESSHLYYSTRTFRIFPTHPGRFFKTKKPLLARLTAAKRSHLTSLELRLGPGWGKPPRGWVVNDALGLHNCVNVRRLTVFVECDPSDGIFKGFRREDNFYENFCKSLLEEILGELPQLEAVYFDAWSSVKKNGAMIRALAGAVVVNGRAIRWGPERGWTGGLDDEEEPATISRTSHAAVLSLGPRGPRPDDLDSIPRPDLLVMA